MWSWRAEPRAVLARPRLDDESEAGFTLAESIVALAILVLAFAALYQSFAVGLAGYRKAEQSLAGAALAQSLLAGAGIAEPLAAGARRGRTGGFDWRIDTAPYGGPGPAMRAEVGPEAFWVTVTVSWPTPAGRGPASLSLATLKLQEPAPQ